MSSRSFLTREASGSPTISSHSDRFRYAKRAHEAGRAVEAANQAGYAHAMDCDLKSFSDTFNHERLMNLLARGIVDPQVLQLMGRYQRAVAVLPDGRREAMT